MLKRIESTMPHPRLQPTPNVAADPTRLWRQQTSLLILRLLLLLALPLITIDLLHNLRLGRWDMIGLSLASLALMSGLVLARRLNDRLRGLALVSLMVAGGINGLFTFGLYGVITLLPLIAILLAVLMLGPRFALAVGLVYGSILAVIFSGFALGYIAYPYDADRFAGEAPELLINWLLLMSTAAFLAMMVGSLVNSLEASLRKTREALAELERLNTSLETTVEQRTAELRQSTVRLEATQRLARVGGFSYDHEHQRSDWSNALYQIHGIPVGTPLDDALLAQLYSGETWPRIQALFAQLIAEGQPFEQEFSANKLDGQPLWVRVSAAADLGQGALRYFGAVQDITVSKQAELALAEQLRYAEALAKCSQILLAKGVNADDWEASIQQALAVLRAAAGCRRLALWLYRSPEELLEVPSFVIADNEPGSPPQIQLPIVVADVPSVMGNAIASGGWLAGPVTTLIPNADNSVRRLLAANQTRSIFLAGLHVAGLWRGHLTAADRAEDRVWSETLVAMFRTGLDMIAAFLHQHETTSTLRAREALLSTTLNRQESLLQAIPDLLLGVSADGSIRFVHAPPVAALTLPANVLDQQFDQVLPQAIASLVATSLADPNAEVSFATVTLKPGKLEAVRTVEARVVAMGDAERLVIVRDITDQRQLQAELEQARDAAEAAMRAKSAFLATMSHEIRTPLNAVIGMVTLLEDSTLSAEQREWLATISSGGQALLAVINDILDFSRIEAGHVTLEPQPFDLHACLRAAVDLVAHEAERKGLSLNYSYQADLPQAVLGDGARLRQILLNLLSNAVKFTSHGTITLQATARIQPAQEALVTISVRDTGIGIALEQLAHIFVPFVQGDSSIARRYGGSGLGLAISHQLVTLMGGTLDVESQPGRGSTFTVTLPLLITTATALPRPEALRSTATRPLHVLVAEDNPVGQEVIQRLLSHMGHRVTMVDNGIAAVAAVAQRHYDVVLMDVQMPQMDGVTATRQIRRLAPEVAQPYIIALTAHGLAGDRERFLRDGMDDYLSKPIQREALQQTLARVAGDLTVSVPPAQTHAGEQQVIPLIAWPVIEQLVSTLGLTRPAVIAMSLQLIEDAIPPQIAEVEAALRAGDRTRLRESAHRLRGGCLQLGAQAMAAISYQLERTDDRSDPQLLIPALHACYNGTLALLKSKAAS
jgi:signal transduction histidine kinase/FixJ family two-component response regulator/HPt (histidine-containing phosphotransfer) domain-containing protein